MGMNRNESLGRVRAGKCKAWRQLSDRGSVSMDREGARAGTGDRGRQTERKCAGRGGGEMNGQGLGALALLGGFLRAWLGCGLAAGHQARLRAQP